MNQDRHGEQYSSLWSLDRRIAFLNHGSFGACPVAILETQRDWQRALEKQPVRFLGRKIERKLDEVRSVLGLYLGAPAEDLALVPNATAGVNTVLRSLDLGPEDELLVTDHAYNACRNALDFVAERAGATVVVANLPFPIASAEQAVDPILSKVTVRTRLLLLDAITSPTGLVLPFERIVQEVQQRGTDVLVDGAHVPGMVDLDLRALGAAYFTGNCHKWMCTPKGSAVLYVRPDRQEQIRPLSISHGANSLRTDRSRFRLEFDWLGTHDPSPFLCIPDAVRLFRKLLPGGWQQLREHNRNLVLEGRRLVCDALEIALPAPESMIGSLASVPLPALEDHVLRPPLFLDPLQAALLEQHKIELPVMTWGKNKHRVLRLSAQLYNRIEQYRHLAEVLPELMNRFGGA